MKSPSRSFAPNTHVSNLETLAKGAAIPYTDATLQVSLLLPVDMLEAIRSVAIENGQSFCAACRDLLEEALTRPGAASPTPPTLTVVR